MKHFKLTDSDLFESPTKLAIFIAVFVTVILCTLVLIQLDINNRTTSVEVANQQAEQVDLVEDYKSGMKVVLNNFLLQRTEEEFEIVENYQNLVNQTLEKVLNLRVPADYKEFHLKLVVLLDKEIQNIEDGGLGKELEVEWNELLSSYTWLSE